MVALWNQLSNLTAALLPSESPEVSLEHSPPGQDNISRFLESAAATEQRLETLIAFHANIGREKPAFRPRPGMARSSLVSAKEEVALSVVPPDSKPNSAVTPRPSTESPPVRAIIQSFDERLVGRLEIPRLGASVMVFEGTQPGTLRKGAGLVENTAWPGEEGNVGIAGHRDTSFRVLRNIGEGDTVVLSTVSGRFFYKVKWKIVVDPSFTNVMAPTPEPSLTLVTCFPFEHLGPAPKRLIVRAVASPYPGPPATGVTNDDETSLRRSTIPATASGHGIPSLRGG
jgi:sortase A